MPPLKHDCIEETCEYKKVIGLVETEVSELLGEDSGRGKKGFCHLYWRTKKAVLKKYGIEWKTPAEANPGVIFD